MKLWIIIATIFFPTSGDIAEMTFPGISEVKKPLVFMDKGECNTIADVYKDLVKRNGLKYEVKCVEIQVK